MNLKIKYSIVIVIIIGILGYFSTGISKESTKNIIEKIVKVEVGNIKKTIDVYGEASLIDEQSISFNKTGTIENVYFNEGEKVKKGDVIIKLDDTDGYSNIEEAKINLENAKINLQELYEKADESKVLEAENKIIKAENSLNTSEKELENLKISQSNSLDEINKNINSLKDELNNLESSFKISENEYSTLQKSQVNNINNTEIETLTTLNNYKTSIDNYIAFIGKVLNEGDYLLGITEANKNKNDNFEDLLGAKNNGLKAITTLSFTEVYNDFQSLKKDISNIKPTSESLILNYNNLLEYEIKLEKALSNFYDMLENTVSSSNSLNESQLSNYKSQFYGYKTDTQSNIVNINKAIEGIKTITNLDLIVESNKNSLESAKDKIETYKVQITKKENEIESEEKKYILKKDEYSIILDSKNKEINTLIKEVSVAKESYKEVIDGPTEENIKKAQNNIKQAQIKLDNSYSDLEDYTLVAPFDGVIRSNDYKVGDKITNDTNKSIYIENPNILELSVTLDQIDIVKVSLLDKAIVNFDTYSDIEVNAVITKIDTTPSVSSGVVTYEVTLILNDDNFTKTVLSGMTADIEIIIEEKNDILLIPSQAIKTTRNKNTVIIKDGGSKKVIEIEIGSSENGKTEVTSGLSEGDQIVIIENNTKNVKKNSGTGLLPLPNGKRGGGGGMGPR